MQIVILCGGLGSRLKNLTKNKPKSLIKIKGSPFIDYQLKLYKKNNFNKALLCYGHLGHKIKKYLDEKEIDFKIEYSYDGKKQLGTGGALKKAFKKLDKQFCVVYGDSYLPINYKSLFTKFNDSKKEIIMTVYKNNNKDDKSNISIVNNKMIYDKQNTNSKMEYIDYGFIMIKKKLISKIKKKKFDLSDLMTILSYKNKVDFIIVNKPFYEIGSRSGIKKFNKYLNK